MAGGSPWGPGAGHGGGQQRAAAGQDEPAAAREADVHREGHPELRAVGLRRAAGHQVDGHAARGRARQGHSVHGGDLLLGPRAGPLRHLRRPLQRGHRGALGVLVPERLALHLAGARDGEGPAVRLPRARPAAAAPARGARRPGGGGPRRQAAGGQGPQDGDQCRLCEAEADRRHDAVAGARAAAAAGASARDGASARIGRLRRRGRR
mmetsp:Transcript_33839/g.89840  ORF Transcript_33839/g.89840 Transcript_33839/m.89840 type:complete len:208 (-) Transcript_33839:35-658(-)